MFNYHDKIEDYLHDRLTPVEKEDFEQAMNVDKELAKLVDEHPLYSAIADEIINQDISDQIKKEQAAQRKKKRETPAYVYAIAAAILLLIIAYPLWPTNSSAQELFEKYYSPPMNQVVRGEQSEDVIQLQGCDQGHLYLEQKDFTKAKESFSQSLNDSNTRCLDKALYYSALIAVWDEDYDLAKGHIQKLLDNDESGYENKAKMLLNEL